MTLRAYLLAHPAGHSLSPLMHGAAFAALGLDATYEALDVPPHDLEAAVRGFRSADAFLGANVTTPHKRAVMRFLDELTPAAEAVSAVNTIIRRGDRLIGDNTDVPGLNRALEEAGVRAGPAEALVLGAGGAARATVYALHTLGMTVRVAARRLEAAGEVALVGESVTALGPPEVSAALAETDLLVNATTVGMQGGPEEQSVPLDADVWLLPERAVVYDLVYRPRVTPLLAAAAARGLRTADGLSMLVWQGAESLRAWTGLEPPVAAMRAAVSGPTPAPTEPGGRRRRG